MEREESMYPWDWVRIAEKDLERVVRALRDGDPDLAGFCLQQAVEKFLKAFLLSKGWKLQRIHDLGRLLDEARLYDAELGQFRELCQKVTVFYVVERYPFPAGFGPTAEEVRTFLEGLEGLIIRLREAIR